MALNACIKKRCLRLSKEADHINKYEHNKNFYNAMDSLNYPDWAVVVLFYESIHLIEGVMARQNEHPTTHEARDSLLKDTTKIYYSRDIRKDYKALENLSRKARYISEEVVTEIDVKMATEYLDEIIYWYKHQTKTA